MRKSNNFQIDRVGVDHIVVSKFDTRMKRRLLKDRFVLKEDQARSLLNYLTNVRVTDEGFAGGWEPGLVMEVVYGDNRVVTVKVSPSLDRWISSEMNAVGGEFEVADGLLPELERFAREGT